MATSDSSAGYFMDPLYITVEMVGKLFRFNIDHLLTYFYTFGFSFIFSWLVVKSWVWYKTGSRPFCIAIKRKKCLNENIKGNCRPYYFGSILHSAFSIMEPYYVRENKPCLKKNAAAKRFSPSETACALLKPQPNQKSTSAKSSLISFQSITSKPSSQCYSYGRKIIPKITIYQLPRSEGIPCRCPQRLYLESILRLCEIPYKIIHTCANPIAPWLSYGNQFCDSMEACMEFLEQTFPNKVEDYQVSEKLKPSARFLAITSRHLTAALTHWRNANKMNGSTGTGQNRSRSRYTNYGKRLINVPSVRGSSFHQTKKDKILREIHNDLLALAASLDNKLSFIGDTLTILDCLIFSTLAQFLWNSSSSGGESISDPLEELIGQHYNLMDFCYHVRSVLWYDWPTHNIMEHDENSYYAIKKNSLKN